jgi:hypothetical protein
MNGKNQNNIQRITRNIRKPGDVGKFKFYIYSKLHRFDKLELRNPGLRILRTVSFQARCDREKIRINEKILTNLTTLQYNFIFTTKTNLQAND